MSKFYLAKLENIKNIEETENIEMQEDSINFEFVNSSGRTIVVTGTIKHIQDSYYFLFFKGGQKDPYNNEIIDTENNNKIKKNPRPQQTPEVTIEYYYLINQEYGYILGNYGSFLALLAYYKQILKKKG